MQKKINEFDRISDMTTFPWQVHLGASVNIVFSMWLTSILFEKTNGNVTYLIPFAVLLITLNLAPVIALRRQEEPNRSFPVASEMNFFSDQHRFASWVYAIASGNMFFWITFSWCAFSASPSTSTLVFAQLFAFTITYVPLWRCLILRLKSHSPAKT